MADTGGRRRGFSASMRRLAASMRSSTPVNKGLSGEAASTRRLPQIENPLLVGAVGLGAVVVGAAARTLRPGRRGGRAARFRFLVARAAVRGEEGVGAVVGPRDFEVEVHEAFGKPALVNVDVRMRADRLLAFFDPGAASSAVHTGGGATPLQGAADAASAVERASSIVPHLAVTDMLDRVVEAAWNNPEIAPVAVRARILVVPPRSAASAAGRAGRETLGGGPQSPSGGGGRATIPGDGGEVVGAPRGRVVAKMEDLGFIDETARPADLFDHYGAPASDPRWRP